MMNKHIFYYLMVGSMALLLGACNDSMNDLLEPKVYFESKEYNFSVEDEMDVMTFDLVSRLSSATSSQVDVSYSVAEPSVVAEYNAKYGTNYEMLDVSQVKLSSTTSSISSGKLYADNVEVELSGLEALKAGNSYVLPMRVHSSSVSTLSGTNIAYFFFSKPLKITKAGNFSNHYISVKFPVGTFFSSFTYEALINVDYFHDNNTIMGTEGVMILRIGDAGGGITPKDYLEVAGRQNYRVTKPLLTNRWYHVALTYDQPTGKTGIYVNGEKWAGSDWGIDGFDPNSDMGFYIGRIYGFKWGERPFHGKMSEVRVWSVARTENQLKQNMLGVDPASEGLALYYKLDGSETQEGGVIKDATGRINGTTNGITIKTLDAPIAIN